MDEENFIGGVLKGNLLLSFIPTHQPLLCTSGYRNTNLTKAINILRSERRRRSRNYQNFLYILTRYIVYTYTHILILYEQFKSNPIQSNPINLKSHGKKNHCSFHHYRTHQIGNYQQFSPSRIQSTSLPPPSPPQKKNPIVELLF